MSEDALESVQHPKDLWSVLRGRWRLVDDPVQGELGLYDLGADPLEQENLYEREATHREQLGALLAKFKERGIRPADAGSRLLIDDDLRDELERLGYAGEGR
jgi:hypothetical protein